MQFCQERRLPLRRNMGIDLRRGNGAVAEERLDIPDVHTGLQQRGGECMAEHMRRHRPCDMEPNQIPANDPPHGLLGERHFPIVQQQGICFMDLFSVAAAVDPHDMEDFRRFNLDDPFLPTLPVDQEPQFLLTELNSFWREPAQFGDPNPGTEQQFQDDNIPQDTKILSPALVFRVGLAQQGLDKILRDRAGQLPRVVDVEPELIKGVLRDLFQFLHGSIKGPNRRQFSLDRAGRECFVQIFDVTADDIPFPRPVSAKTSVLPQVNLVRLQGVRR